MFPSRPTCYSGRDISKLREGRRALKEAQASTSTEEPHQHDLTTVYFLEQKDGVPYALEQVSCADCKKIVDEARRRLVA